MSRVLQQYWPLISFGLLAAFCSGFGQTFFISLFIPAIRESFTLSKSEIASYYSLATLLSAFVLPAIGRLFDRSRIHLFAITTLLLLASGCFALALSWSPYALLIGFFLLRNLGQGTLSLVATTTTARFFGTRRGSALGIVNLGYPLSEAILPPLVAMLIISLGWRQSLGAIGLSILLCIIPCLYILLRSMQASIESITKDPRILGHTNETSHATMSDTRSWTVHEMLRDYRFYLLIAPALLPAFVLTALFFHQGTIGEWKSWSLTEIAYAFTSFAVFRAVSSFVSGYIVDRLGARPLFALTIAPIALGCLFLLEGTGQLSLHAYLALCGVTMGSGLTVKAALWAELYGPIHLGAIKSINASLAVFSTALAPILFGLLLDKGVSMHTLVAGTIFVSVCCIPLAWLGATGTPTCKEGSDTL